ncbi:hypothetical protein KP509_20G090700 [Ceratopteris richardii]|uniref:Uncharacterized protein n=1 Tax=Ceratopteris richardii TaxID=49495 RepID=A0A8T2SKF8_CERRI|nr:hypothetical protein KP509_20G090700 [Ceratopteris richardii]
MASIFLIIIVFLLNLIVFGLSIGAEQRRAMGEYMKDNTTDYQYCRYNSDIAIGLAVGALLFLLTSQVLILASTRCLCCGNALKPDAAPICYLAGAVQNVKHIRYLSYFPVTNKPLLFCCAQLST